MSSEPVVYEKATVLCYRIFDVASEIQLEHSQRLLTEDTRRLKLARENSQYLHLPNPPLTVELGKRDLVLTGQTISVEVVARLFDHGAASIILKVPVRPGTTHEQLIPLADELFDSPSVDALSLELIDHLRRTLAPAIEKGHLWDQSESYTVVFAERIAGEPDASSLMQRADLSRLLLGERDKRPLSDRERVDVTSARFSYRDDDLVVVDWNSAFVYEPSGSNDIPDLLEICNAQLLEFRFYDAQLDEQLLRIYDQMQKPQPGGWFRLFRSPYTVLARRVLVTLMEMSEFVERVDNSLKIIGDFYLARVYEAAVKRLRIPPWQASVTRKQQMLGQVYQLLKGEVDTARALTLEATIVLLIILEIFMALFSVVH